MSTSERLPEESDDDVRPLPVLVPRPAHVVVPTPARRSPVRRGPRAPNRAGRRRRGTRASARHRAWWKRPGGVVALVLVAVLLVGGGAAGYEGWTIKQHADGLIARVGGELQAGADALTAGKAAVGKAASNNDPAPLKEATAQFEVARHH